MISRPAARITLALVLALALGTLAAIPLAAQTAEVKEKAPLYTYVSFWALPRAQWAAAEKGDPAEQSLMQKAMSAGSLIAYGSDINLVHGKDGITHDDWFAANSMAGLMNVLDQLLKSGSATAAVPSASTVHGDGIYVSRFYNWRPGSYKGAYTHGSAYKLKPDAPDEAVETLSKTLMVPLLEKLLANGAIVEYDIDTEALHSESPYMFWVFYTAPTADGLDKVNAAIREAIKANPLAGQAFDSMTDPAGHRDMLSRTNATFK